jgi:hypothetical protein
MVQGDFLICSCPFFSRYGIPCRHMLAVNRGQVVISDFHIRWTTLYVQGKMDNILNSVDFQMSPGAAAAFEWTVDVDVEAPNDDSQNAADENDEGVELGAAAIENDEEENNEPESDDEQQVMQQAMELDFVNGRQLSLSTPIERYCAMQICTSEVQEMGRHFS